MSDYTFPDLQDPTSVLPEELLYVGPRPGQDQIAPTIRRQFFIVTKLMTAAASRRPITGRGDADDPSLVFPKSSPARGQLTSFRNARSRAIRFKTVQVLNHEILPAHRPGPKETSTTAFLKARLFDILVGLDRHRTSAPGSSADRPPGFPIRYRTSILAFEASSSLSPPLACPYQLQQAYPSMKPHLNDEQMSAPRRWSVRLDESDQLKSRITDEYRPAARRSAGNSDRRRPPHRDLTAVEPPDRAPTLLETSGRQVQVHPDHARSTWKSASWQKRHSLQHSQARTAVQSAPFFRRPFTQNARIQILSARRSLSLSAPGGRGVSRQCHSGRRHECVEPSSATPPRESRGPGSVSTERHPPPAPEERTLIPPALGKNTFIVPWLAYAAHGTTRRRHRHAIF